MASTTLPEAASPRRGGLITESWGSPRRRDSKARTSDFDSKGPGLKSSPRRTRVDPPEMIIVCTMLRESFNSMESAFDAFDCNGDGDVEAREFRHVLARLLPVLSESQLDSIVGKHMVYDDNDPPAIGFKQFVKSFALCLVGIQDRRLAKLDKPGTQAEKDKYPEIQVLHAIIRHFLRASFDNAEKAFAFFDLYKRGRIAPLDFGRGLRRLKMVISQSSVACLHRMIDSSCNGSVDFDEFEYFFTDTSKPHPRRADMWAPLVEALEGRHSCLQAAFHRFDVSPPAGTLCSAEMVQGLLEVCKEARLHEIKKRQIELLFREMDRNRDGVVNCEEWTQLLSHRRGQRKSEHSDDEDVSSEEEEVAFRSPRKQTQLPQLALPSIQHGPKGQGGPDDLLSSLAATLKYKYSSLFHAFQEMDSNGDGEVSRLDILYHLKSLGLGLSTYQLERIMTLNTRDSTGSPSKSRRNDFLDYPSFLRLFA